MQELTELRYYAKELKSGLKKKKVVGGEKIEGMSQKNFLNFFHPLFLPAGLAYFRGIFVPHLFPAF